jgi:hypothetical protein
VTTTIDGFDRGVVAGDPAALRRLVEAIAAKHRVSIRWTADSNEWYATGRHTVSVPPPIDRVAAAICLHELAHCVAGRCPRTGAHRAKVTGDTLACLACEHIAWDIAQRWMPFDRAEHERLRRALGSYRRGTPAPLSTQHEADQLMGTVEWARRRMAADRMRERYERQARANASVAASVTAESEKRRRFDAMVERTRRAKESV